MRAAKRYLRRAKKTKPLLSAVKVGICHASLGNDPLSGVESDYNDIKKPAAVALTRRVYPLGIRELRSPSRPYLATIVIALLNAIHTASIHGPSLGSGRVTAQAQAYLPRGRIDCGQCRMCVEDHLPRIGSCLRTSFHQSRRTV